MITGAFTGQRKQEMKKLKVKLKKRKNNITLIDSRRVNNDVVDQAEFILEKAKLGDAIGMVSVLLYSDGSVSRAHSGINERNSLLAISELDTVKNDLIHYRLLINNDSIINRWANGDL